MALKKFNATLVQTLNGIDTMHSIMCVIPHPLQPDTESLQQ